jgi:hypothetical protein
VSGVFEAAVERLTAELAYPPDDPRAGMLDLARRLAVLMDLDESFAGSCPIEDGLPPGDWFRSCIEQAGEDPNDPPGPADEFRLRRLRRLVGPIVGDPLEPPTGNGG